MISLVCEIDRAQRGIEQSVEHPMIDHDAGLAAEGGVIGFFLQKAFCPDAVVL